MLQFKFYDPSEDRGPMSEKENRRVTDSVLEGHMDPFYAECRAYARIGEEKRNKKRKRDIAVPCYGFLSIPAEWEEKLYRRFGVEAWERPDEEYSSESQRQPFRALVKELVRDDTP